MKKRGASGEEAHTLSLSPSRSFAVLPQFSLVYVDTHLPYKFTDHTVPAAFHVRILGAVVAVFHYSQFICNSTTAINATSLHKRQTLSTCIYWHRQYKINMKYILRIV